ncbi:hypothetical protein QFC22_002497, partial [Naganishia vaughanmartiniae]
MPIGDCCTSSFFALCGTWNTNKVSSDPITTQTIDTKPHIKPSGATARDPYGKVPLIELQRATTQDSGESIEPELQPEPLVDNYEARTISQTTANLFQETMPFNENPFRYYITGGAGSSASTGSKSRTEPYSPHIQMDPQATEDKLQTEEQGMFGNFLTGIRRESIPARIKNDSELYLGEASESIDNISLSVYLYNVAVSDLVMWGYGIKEESFYQVVYRYNVNTPMGQEIVPAIEGETVSIKHSEAIVGLCISFLEALEREAVPKPPTVYPSWITSDHLFSVMLGLHKLKDIALKKLKGAGGGDDQRGGSL